MTEILRSELKGRRWTHLEVAGASFDVGFRRRNLNIFVATLDWESARYEAARLIYVDLTSDDGLGQVNSEHSGHKDEPATDAWYDRVWNGFENLAICRGIYDRRFAAYKSSEAAFGAWYAFLNGNYRRSWQVAKHATAQVDPSYFEEQSFLWFNERWVPGDGLIFETRWKVSHGGTLRGYQTWKDKHPKFVEILYKSSQVPDAVPVLKSTTKTPTEIMVLMTGENSEQYNILGGIS